MAEHKLTWKMRLMGAWMHLHGLMPLGYHRAWAHGIAAVVDKLFHYREAVILKNLRNAFPNKPEAEIQRLKKRFYLHFATILTETVWFSACRGPWGRRRLHRSHIVELTNPEELNRLYNGARQLMLLQSHTGNWELIGGILQYFYGTEPAISADAFAVTYLRLHSDLWDALMARGRTAPVADLGFGGYVETSQVMRYVLQRREQKFGYSFITDQYPYTGAHVPVEFMHQPTVMMVGAASLACKLDMAVAYLRFECREGGGYRMTVVPLSPHAGGEDPQALMKRYFKLLEEDLEQQPWNYLWSHNRWK